MDTYTISFFGGKKIKDTFAAESELEEILVNILRTKENLRFIVSSDNDFSSLADYVLHRLKHNFNSDCRIVLVRFENEKTSPLLMERYSKIEYFSAADSEKRGHLRDRYVIDSSDMVIFFIEREISKICSLVKYAQKIHRKILYIVK